MKKSITLLGLLCALNSFAQVGVSPDESMPTKKYKREYCIINDDHGANTRCAATQDKAQLRATGSPKIVVCLANYADVKFTVANSNDSVVAVFNTFFNGRGVGAGQNKHSVYDYFNEMSGGIFTPEFIITEPVTLSRERSYYGDKYGSSRRSKFRDEALTLLAPQIKDRIGELDTNDDNKIDGVIIIFPGCGANVGDENGMHPACWTNNLTNSGITYATELVAPELQGFDHTEDGGENEAVINGIGVYLHEMSHMLGLPDFYDINYKGAGMDRWSLMDYGEYWMDGYEPTPYTAYEKNFLGWLSLIELSEPANIINMKAINDGGSAYIIYNEGDRNEYYILENRTTYDPWTSSLCASLGNGLMIYHVTYDANAWSSNRINTDVNRQRMTIIPANGHFEIIDNFDSSEKYFSEMRGHLWPLSDRESVLKYWGIRGNNSLTDEERTEGDRIAPAARLHNPNTDGTYFMHKPITNIAFEDDSQRSISFTFNGGDASAIEDVINNTTHKYTYYSIDGRYIVSGDKEMMRTLPSGLYIVRNITTGEVQKRYVNNR